MLHDKEIREEDKKIYFILTIYLYKFVYEDTNSTTR